MRAARRFALPLACLILASLACDLLNPTPVAWSLTVTPDLSTATPAPSTKTAAPPAPATPLPPKPTPLSPANHLPVTDGWSIYAQAGGQTLFVRKPGEADPLTIELPGPLLSAGELRRGISPTGEWLAVRTGQADYSELTLHLVHLPDGQVRRVASLLSATLEKQVLASLSGRAMEAALAVVEPRAVRWSPDGRKLAFVGAFSGISSDLYVYDLGQDKLDRLTTGSNQAATPYWSPDGKWIVHQEVVTFGTDTGWKVRSVLAAAADHHEIRRMFNPEPGSSGEVFLGWNEAEGLYIYTWQAVGAGALREIPVNLRWLNQIYAGPFDEIARDPHTNAFLFSAGEQTSLRARLLPGLYWLAPPDTQPDLVQVGEWRDLTWWEQPGVFTASGFQGALTFSGRKIQLVKGEGWVVPSPDGLWLAGWGEPAVKGPAGVRLYRPDGRLSQEVFPGSTEQVTWLPDSTGFYFVAEGQLYLFTFASPEIQLIAEDVYPGSLLVVGSEGEEE